MTAGAREGILEVGAGEPFLAHRETEAESERGLT